MGYCKFGLGWTSQKVGGLLLVVGGRRCKRMDMKMNNISSDEASKLLNAQKDSRISHPSA